jgi:hypothetical protein
LGTRSTYQNKRKCLSHSLTHSLTHGAEPFLRRCQLCSYSRTSQHFMEPGGSSPRSHKPSTGPYPEPDRSNSYIPSYLCKIHFNIESVCLPFFILIFFITDFLLSLLSIFCFCHSLCLYLFVFEPVQSFLCRYTIMRILISSGADMHFPRGLCFITFQYESRSGPRNPPKQNLAMASYDCTP